MIVTEKATNVIASYRIRRQGLSGPLVTASHGTTPFGFAFDDQGTLVVSEAFGGTPGASAVSTYRLGHRGQLNLLPGAAPAGAGPIDAVISADGRFLYTLNSGNQTIGVFSIGRDGDLEPRGSVSGIPAGANGLAGK